MSYTAPVEALETAPRRGYRFLAIAAIATLAVGWLVYLGLRGNTSYYMEVDDLLNKGAATYNQQTRVAGKVEPGSIRREGSQLEFVAADTTGKIKVAYDGVVPDIFKDNVEVVVEGRYTPQGVFQAHTLLAKCPSKFEAAPAAAGVETQ